METEEDKAGAEDEDSRGTTDEVAVALNDAAAIHVSIPSKSTEDSHTENAAFGQGEELQHKTILGRDSSSSTSVSLQRCIHQNCCGNKVHCPFCNIRQYKPAQPARVKDHLHLTHFQHAVYYDGLMIVKCFHACRGNDTKGGHYHCPACGTTLLKRNAFTKHLLSHAAREGLGNSAVQAPDAKKPAVVYFEGNKIELCRNKCPNTLEPHFHCPLCQRNCEQLSALTAHLWRCRKRAVSVAAQVDSGGVSVNVATLFSPEAVQTVTQLKEVDKYKWHLSIVRNLSDLPMVRCELSGCCKGRYHCPLCTTAKLKPNHLCHMKQHFVSHWRSGVKFKDYAVLVCYLACELSDGVDKIRFHYHCPLCGCTRRRREGFARHLLICDPSQPRGQSADAKVRMEELDNDEGEDCMEFASSSDAALVPLPESEVWTSHLTSSIFPQSTLSRRASADQAELQAAESLADMDRILTESLSKATDVTSQSLASANSQPVNNTVHVTLNAQSVQPLKLQGHAANPVVKLRVQESSPGTERNQSSKETAVLSSPSDVTQELTHINQSNQKEMASSQPEKSSPDSSDAQCLIDADTASEKRHSSDTLEHQSEGITPNASDPQISTSQENDQNSQMDCEMDAVQEMAEGLQSPSKEKGCGDFKDGLDENVQIFQPVTTHISDSIVSELQKRGELEQCLQAIGQFCTVAWQLSGTVVTMTCDLEELCHAQNCLKRILKDGLKSFLESPPAKPSLSADNPQASAASSASTSMTSPPLKSGRKRGRPQGSKNKSKLRTGRDGSASISKRTKSDTARNQSTVSENQSVEQKETDITGAHFDHSPRNGSSDNQQGDRSSAFLQRSRSSAENSQSNSNRGCYSGRTRGKRINFAQLNAGNVSPPHESSLEEAKRPAQPSPSVDTGPKRGRGRPRKLQTLKFSEPLRQVQKEASVKSSDLTETRAPQQDADDHVEGDGVPCNGGGDNDTDQTAETVEQSYVEADVTSDISVKVRRRSQSVAGSANLNIVVNHSACPLQENSAPVPSSHSKPHNGSLLQTAGEENAVHAVEEKDLSEGGGKGEERESKSPTIIGRGRGMYRSRKGASDFAIIPNIVFDFAIDTAADENDALDQTASQEDSTETNSGNLDSGLCRSHNDDGKEECSQHVENSTETQAEAAKQLKCPVCKSAHTTYSLLISHISAQHPDTTAATGSACETVTPSSGTSTSQLECRHGSKQETSGETPPKMYTCLTCGKTCESLESLRWHGKLVHKEEVGRRRGRPRLKCAWCSYVAMDSWDMRHHREQHRNQAATCPMCKKALSTEAALKVHMAAKHTSDCFTCQICNKTFAHMRYLRSHMQRHGGEKRHVCSICGWRFYQTNTLRAHMDTHKPRSQRRYSFKCPHCPAAYNSRANWRDHLNKHTGARPHICGTCGKGFAFRSMLTTHAAFVHSVDRPHSCTECDKKYKTKAQLRQHLMTHTMARTGTSPFMCTRCGRPMASKSRLHAHSVRCKGNNYKHVFWHKGSENIVEAVHLTTGLPVSFQTPLVDLLPGQHISVVQQGFGKDATLTLVPVQTSAAEEVTILASDDRKPALPSDGTSNQPMTSEQEAVNKDPIYQSALNSNADVADTQTAADSQQTAQIKVQDSSLLPGAVLRDLSRSVSMISDNNTRQQTIIVQDGQAVHLLSDTDISSQLQTQTLNFGDQMTETSLNSGPAENLSGSQQTALTDSSQPVGSHHVVVSDSFGQTHSLLLPSDFIKQEVVVIESEDGHQNVIDLSNIQIVHADDVADQVSVQRQDADGDGGDQHQNVQILQPLDGHGIGYQTDVEGHDPSAHASDQSESGVSGQTAQGEVGESELSVYMCSRCRQQFDSMEQAEQHILVHHPVEAAVSPGEGDEGNVSTDEGNLSTDAHRTAEDISMEIPKEQFMSEQNVQS